MHVRLRNITHDKCLYHDYKNGGAPIAIYCCAVYKSLKALWREHTEGIRLPPGEAFKRIAPYVVLEHPLLAAPNNGSVWRVGPNIAKAINRRMRVVVMIDCRLRGVAPTKDDVGVEDCIFGDEVKSWDDVKQDLWDLVGGKPDEPSGAVAMARQRKKAKLQRVLDSDDEDEGDQQLVQRLFNLVEDKRDTVTWAPNDYVSYLKGKQLDFWSPIFKFA